MKKILTALLVIPFLCSSAFAGQQAQVAGIFYRADAKELDSQIAGFLGGAGQNPASPSILLVPHAGYEYSGAVAGRAFREIVGKDYTTVIMLGVAHRFPLAGAALDSKGDWETPLGKVAIDTDSAIRLATLSEQIRYLPQAFKNEHSLEVLLPFLQKSLKQFRILPLLMQEPELKKAQEIGEAIATLMTENRLAGKKTLLVISTDFSHYPNQEDAEIADGALLRALEAVNPEQLFNAAREVMKKKIPNLVTPMCGEAAALAGLYAAKALGIPQASMLLRTTSARSPKGDPSKVVGYAALAFYETGKPTIFQKAPKLFLTGKHKKELLQNAKDVVDQYVSTGTARQTMRISEGILNKPQAVFVTLRKKGELRGCMGTTYPKYPLKQAVVYYAVQAAVEDSRFPPVKKEELPDLSYEISILSPQKLAAGPDDIKPGKHGVVLIQDNHVGLLLPQVWKETGWTKEQFLNALASQKAGLKPDAWKDPRTRLYIFTAKTFRDPAPQP